jgi:enoyl-[acyl-carrier protein] reductase II
MINPICEALRVRYPILLGGLLKVGTAPLVAAVAKAGGFGILGAGAWNKDELKSQIDKTREMTSRPFGVNIVVRGPHAKDHVKIVIDEGITAVTTSAGNPQIYTHALKQAGIYVMHVVPSVEFARIAEKAGVDAIITEGVESGGFTSLDEVTTFTLVPQVADAVKLPVIAAGGIGDGRGFAAALALGAVGVQIGTVFLATEEAQASDVYKMALLMANDTSTRLVRMGRAAQRRITEELQEKLRGAVTGDKPLQELNTDNNSQIDWDNHIKLEKMPKVISAGQVAGLVKKIITVNELVENMVKDAKNILGPDNIPSRLIEQSHGLETHGG